MKYALYVSYVWRIIAVSWCQGLRLAMDFEMAYIALVTVIDDRIDASNDKGSSWMIEGSEEPHAAGFGHFARAQRNSQAQADVVSEVLRVQATTVACTTEKVSKR